MTCFILNGCKKADNEDQEGVNQDFPSGIVAYINDTPVTLKEFQVVLSDQRAKVSSYFYQEYGAEYSEAFWETRFRDEVPLEMARELAFQELTSRKVQQKEMSKYQLGPDLDYDSFLKGFDSINRKRKETVEKGGIIYGPIEYTERTYFSYLFSNAQTRLKEKMVGKEIIITDSALKAKYTDLIPKYFRKPVGGTSGEETYSPDAFRPFKEVREQVVSLYIDDTYDQWVSDQVRGAKVRLNIPLIDTLTLVK